MRFHRQKMDEINQIIKELWIKTYKGGDIDTIRICSDDSTQSDSSTVIARRTYNYRVRSVVGGVVWVQLDFKSSSIVKMKIFPLAYNFLLHISLSAFFYS